MMQRVSISRLTLAAGMTSMIPPAFAADAGFITDATATLLNHPGFRGGLNS